ncbi:MAG: aldo/keto reductase [Lachnospiraceae bacterium]|uniref:Aldo/keto reductase n=1 Tax=Candidatus Enterocloster excrementigallinarum TaxID=2838558 RepID=A0A9D2PX87_9FIRM|nr:aldo/keto reductase [Lachnospiraceae bacterium]HJC67928.1 aldo/keto reductase [Candidatus Enterocloster excrementigallinarum]
MAERRGKYRLWQSGHHVSAASIEQVLQAARTDYTDFGLVHCIDEEDDYRRVMARGGLFDYMRSLKAQGVVRHLGFSTHTPSIARRFMETGETDLFMFSLNPTYDYSRGQLSYGRGQERLELYQEAERRGVGITVMKPFAGGQLRLLQSLCALPRRD